MDVFCFDCFVRDIEYMTVKLYNLVSRSFLEKQVAICYGQILGIVHIEYVGFVNNWKCICAMCVKSICYKWHNLEQNRNVLST